MLRINGLTLLVNTCDTPPYHPPQRNLINSLGTRLSGVVRVLALILSRLQVTKLPATTRIACTYVGGRGGGEKSLKRLPLKMKELRGMN